VGDRYTQTVRVSNVSNERVTITKISGSSADLGISQVTFPLVLEAGGRATFLVSYHPKKTGRCAERVYVITSASTTPWSIGVKASAVEHQLELTASDASVEFGEVAAGSASSKEVTLTNAGNADMAISKIEVSGEGFNVSGAPVTLNAGQQMSVSVRFDPKSGGNRSGTMMVYSNAPDSPLRIALSGAGAVMSGQTVSIKWEKSEGAENGYFVYRSSEPGGPYTKLQAATIPNPEFTDLGLAAGRTYYYVVTSVDANGSESGYSEQMVVNIP